MRTRREFLKLTAMAGAGLLVPWKWDIQPALAQAIPGGTLDPTSIPKYVAPLVKPPVFPRKGKIKMPGMKNAEYYEIAMRQFQQQILPPGLPMTTVWSYGPADATTFDLANRFFYPAFTLENKWRKPTVVKWVNGLVDAAGVPLPHILPVDPTLHWANPIGKDRDTRPPRDPSDDYWRNSLLDPNDGRYIGPVPMVTHVHGAHTFQESDGYPEAWYLPAGASGVKTTGTFFDKFNPGDWGPGFAVFGYPNDQRATTLWYHDHTLGMTRLNVYAGPAGFYLIRGGPDDMVLDSRDDTMAILPGPAPGKRIDPFGTYYEIPIVIQDRSFNADGSLFYPDNRAFFEGLNTPPTVPYLDIPFIPDFGCTGFSDVPPIWQPEFFGNTMVVNGQTWPYLEVEKRRYRFRFLNGCNSRFLILQFSDPRVEVWQIGAEGGFLPAPVRINDLNVGGLGGVLLMGPAERADVIVDFTHVPRGSEIILLNLGPDEPFGGFPTPASDPNTTGQVMQFRVVGRKGPDKSTPPHRLVLPAITPLGPPDNTRQVSLNEEESATVLVSTDGAGNVVLDCTYGAPFGPTAALLGTVEPGPTGKPLLWGDDITENPAKGDTETWEIYNFTEDAHPIHVHLVQFQVVDRQPLDGDPRPPEAWETGFKDTVISYPGEITRIKARFDIPGQFVWHCHIVEHEDNEMMRPYHVAG